MRDFVLKIQLGNDAMDSGMDVARALRNTADRLETLIEDKMRPGAFGSVSDTNGNPVGSWEVQ